MDQEQAEDSVANGGGQRWQDVDFALVVKIAPSQRQRELP